MPSFRATVSAAAGSFRQILANRDIRQIQFAWASGTAADWALLVAVLVVAYETGGAVAVGVLGLVRMVPATIVALFVTIPRAVRQERVLVWINLLRAAAAAVLAGTLLADGPVAIVFGAAGVVAAIGSLVRPTQTALLPSLARTPDELIASNVASSTGESAGMFLGPIAGGILLAVGGPAAAATAVAVTFSLSAMALAVIRIPRAASAMTSPTDAGRGLDLPIVEGWGTLARRPSAALIVLAFGSQVLVRGALTTLIVLASIELLGLGDAGVGLLNGLIGAGGFVGAAASIALVGRARLAPVFALALIGWGVPLSVLGAAPLVAVALAAMVVVGVNNAVLDVAGFTLLQRTIPNEQRLAVFRFLEGLIGIGVATGGLLAPLLVAALDVRGALIVTGLVLPGIALLTWPRVSRVDREVVIPERELLLLRRAPMFALLPLSALERLAGALERSEVAAGEVLMREGDAGDRFYVVESGAFEVTQRGARLGSCGPGDGVGEIALLRDLPRTATVTATEPSTVLALERGDFLVAVTGHPGSMAAADGVIAERLARSNRAGAG